MQTSCEGMKTNIIDSLIKGNVQDREVAMAFDHYVTVNGKQMRLGYTTGSCAALAAGGAAALLAGGEAPEVLRLMTPRGIPVEVTPEGCYMEDGAAVCLVRKDGGDDRDATDGLVIGARVSHLHGNEILIEGGTGIGRVTRPGLDQPVGEAAINSVPRRMIREAARAAADKAGYKGGLQITIFAPEGEAAAARTFNGNLGIVGGISIIGTSGIVEPMSLKAFSDAVCLEIRQRAAEGHNALVLTPGNYGLAYLAENEDLRGLLAGIGDDGGQTTGSGAQEAEGRAVGSGEQETEGRAVGSGAQETEDRAVGSGAQEAGAGGLKTAGNSHRIPVVVCSNFIGDALDECAARGIEQVLLVGHVGKLIKLAGGIMNTHSRFADCRMELMAAHAALAGADRETVRELMESVTTDAGIDILEKAGLREIVMESLIRAAGGHVAGRTAGKTETAVVMFSNVYGFLGATENAAAMTAAWKEKG